MNASTAPPSRLSRSLPPGTPAILTAEQFINLPDTRGLELDRGCIVELPVPGFQHGVVCAETSRVLANFAKEHDLGRVLSNDSHLQVPSLDDSGTDTVRGMDVAFFSWDRVPRDQRPVGLPPNPPEWIVEVRSPSDRRGAMLTKIGQYLARGVDVVTLLDPERRTAHMFTQEEEFPAPLGDDAILTPGDFLPGFSLRVGDLLEG
ncbi:Uma2 family endonuclease [Alienimonas chondri]|uniref:Putative restriction endonuclease domain-containing protein n=1 Tax=Alienimonas chondri TaxID=2681879 RepID=A0ABX1VHH1_9PLAN|nr:Uma2 family endonuclease [Alienimonas chondri]NNJ26916.1 hypothetical protein [Alienimonas chondri]